MAKLNEWEESILGIILILAVIISVSVVYELVRGDFLTSVKDMLGVSDPFVANLMILGFAIATIVIVSYFLTGKFDMIGGFRKGFGKD